MRREMDQILLRVANKACYLPLALANTASVAEMLGFSAGDVKKIQLGIEEALAYVIGYGYLPGELAWFDLVYEAIPVGLEITIREQGVPLDELKVEEQQAAGPDRLLDGPGLGLRLLKNCLDRVTFSNLGRNGQEIRLVKYFSETAGSDSAGEAGAETADRQGPPDRASDYSVRPLAMDDAGEVAKCAYSSYGYSYAYEHIYYPQRIRELNRTGTMLSYVAVTTGAEPEIIGHAALVRRDGRQATEMGVAFVKPAFRGNGCLIKLSDALLEEARAADLESVYLSAVTTHAMSQKAASRLGFNETALLLSCVPELRMRQIKEDNVSRESLMIATRYLKETPADVILYPPPRHRDMIGRIYRRSGAEPTLAEAGEGCARGQAVIETTTDKYQSAQIYVRRYGDTVTAEVASVLRNLCINRVESIFLYLNLSDPETARQAIEFEDSGFFFAGIFPGPAAKDWLVLQYLNNQRIDYGQICTGSEAGRELVEYVRACDPTVSE